MKCAKIPPWVKNPIGGRIVGANDARLPIPWQVLITNALKGEKKRSDFSIESTKSQCVIWALNQAETVISTVLTFDTIRKCFAQNAWEWKNLYLIKFLKVPKWTLTFSVRWVGLKPFFSFLLSVISENCFCWFFVAFL